VTRQRHILPYGVPWASLGLIRNVLKGMRIGRLVHASPEAGYSPEVPAALRFQRSSSSSSRSRSTAVLHICAAPKDHLQTRSFRQGVQHLGTAAATTSYEHVFGVLHICAAPKDHLQTRSFRQGVQHLGTAAATRSYEQVSGMVSSARCSEQRAHPDSSHCTRTTRKLLSRRFGYAAY
jgi:hypothetical protein